MESVEKDELDYLQPGEEPKHFTQIISLIVGVLLTILGMAGILFSGFAGLHMGPGYSLIIAVSGVTLFYNGYKNKSRNAFLCCLGFSIFYGLNAIAGWVFGKPGIPTIGFDAPDPKLLQIIPHFHELGKHDHVLNTILALVLMGGAIDWGRRNTRKGKRKEELLHEYQEFKKDYRARHPQRPVHQ